LAVTSLVCGIVSLPLACFCGVGIIPAIAALLVGYRAISRIRASGGMSTGDGLAYGGIVLGWVTVGLVLISIPFWFLSSV
jgi:hypothetical protein